MTQHNPDIRASLEIARARWLLDRLHIIYLGGGGMAAGLTLGLLLTAPTVPVLAWGGVALAYFLACRHLNSRVRHVAIDTLDQARRWHRYAAAASVFQGLKWGAAAWLFLDPAAAAQALLVLGVVVSVVAGAMLVMASHPRCYAVLAALAVAPLLARLVEAGPAHYVLACLLAVSTAIAIYLVLDTARGLNDSFLTQIEHRQLSARLADAVQTAESAVEARDELLAHAGHDLRAPIVALELLASDLARHPTTTAHEAVAHKHRHMRDELRELSALVDTLLDLGMASTPARHAPQTVALAPVLDSTVARFNPLARAHNVDLRHAATDFTAHVEPVLLRRMLDNLVTNAIRHARGGRVLLAARRTGDDVRIEVRDSGAGMPMAHQQRAFHAGTTLDDRTDPLLARKGLGLAIVRQLAERIGAHIALRSTPGQGTVVGIVLPTGQPRRFSQAEESARPARRTA